MVFRVRRRNMRSGTDCAGTPSRSTGPPVVVEDHSYAVPQFGGSGQNVPDRMYRRRTLQTIVDLRNL